MCSRPPPHTPTAPRVPGTPWVPTPREKRKIQEVAAKVHKEVTEQQGLAGPQQVAPPPPTPQAGSSNIPARTHGTVRASVAPATTATPPPQKSLQAVPDHQRGKRWHARNNKAFTPWDPIPAQLWESHHFLKGEGEWATVKATYLPLPAKGAASMRYLCGDDSCDHLSALVLDARGHFQTCHLEGLTSSPLCSCRNNVFHNAATLADHLDVQHNIHSGGVMRDPPRVFLIWLDRRCATQGDDPPTPKRSRKTKR